MAANRFRALSIVVLNCAGLLAALSVLFAGSHQYGDWSRVWQSVGIGGLLMLGLSAYLLSAAVLADVRRSSLGAFRPLLVFYFLSAAPMLMTILLVVVHVLFAD